MSFRSILLASAALLVLPFAAVAAEEKPLTKPEVEQIIKEYLVNNPEVLVQAMDNLQKKQMEAESKRAKEGLSKNKDQIFGNKNAPQAGNPKGDVTVVEFFDYHCGYCKKIFPDIVKLIEEDKNVRVVFKELPIFGQKSNELSALALAVHRVQPDKYFAFHSEMMKQSADKSPEGMNKLFKELGLDGDKVRKEAESDAVKQILADNQKLASELGIRGTPALIIGDQLIPGAIGLSDLKATVAKARSAGKEDKKDEKKAEKK